MTGPIVPVVVAFVVVYGLPRLVHLFTSGHRAVRDRRRNPLCALERIYLRRLG